MSEAQRILLTGGSGFLGRSLIAELTKRHPLATIIVFDTVHPSLSGVVFVRGNVLDAVAVDAVMAHTTHVVHLASPVGVRITETEPDICRKIIVGGTRNVLEAARRHGVERLVFASSSEVYGSPSILPLPETAPCAPVSEYGRAKLVAEALVNAFGEQGDLDVRIVRPFNAYGAGQRKEFVIPLFIDALRRGEAPKIYGPGTQVRCFCNHRDMARGFVAALFASRAPLMTFNLGNASEPLSMVELARRMIAISGRKLEPRHVDFGESDRREEREIWWRIPDVSRAERYLRFRAEIPLETGLRPLLAGDEVPLTAGLHA